MAKTLKNDALLEKMQTVRMILFRANRHYGSVTSELASEGSVKEMLDSFLQSNDKAIIFIKGKHTFSNLGMKLLKVEDEK